MIFGFVCKPLPDDLHFEYFILESQTRNLQDHITERSPERLVLKVYEIVDSTTVDKLWSQRPLAIYDDVISHHKVGADPQRRL